MLALMTVSKGRELSAGGVGGSSFSFRSCVLYSSDLMASSPRTAYFASLTCGFMLSILSAFRLGVEDIFRERVEGTSEGR